MPDLLNSLTMGRVSRDQVQAVLQGDGRYHRVSPPNGLAGTFQLTLNSAPYSRGGSLQGRSSRIFIASSTISSSKSASSRIEPSQGSGVG